MDIKKKFLELKKEWKSANNVERERIDAEIDLLFKSLSDAEKTGIIAAVNDDFDAINHEISEIRQILDIREKLSPVLPVISMSYLAKNYFQKTPFWFYQRLNGNKVNGKPAKFTENEIEKLNFAIQDISRQLSAVSL